MFSLDKLHSAAAAAFAALVFASVSVGAAVGPAQFQTSAPIFAAARDNAAHA